MAPPAGAQASGGARRGHRGQQGQPWSRGAAAAGDELEPTQHFGVPRPPGLPSKNSGRCCTSTALSSQQLLCRPPLWNPTRKGVPGKCRCSSTKLKVKLGALRAGEQGGRQRPDSGSREPCSGRDCSGLHDCVEEILSCARSHSAGLCPFSGMWSPEKNPLLLHLSLSL